MTDGGKTFRWPILVGVAVGVLASVVVAKSLDRAATVARNSVPVVTKPSGPSRYTARETLDYGNLVMDPDTTNAPTRLSQTQALEAANSFVPFAHATRGFTPQVRYGLFTNGAQGTPDASGKLIPLTTRTPAWMVLWRKVPWAGLSGGGATPSKPSDRPQRAFPADIAIVVADDANGTMLFAGTFTPT
jgi:hypothetical protein